MGHHHYARHVTLLTSLLLLHRIKTVGFPEPLPSSNSICSSYNDDTTNIQKAKRKVLAIRGIDGYSQY